MDIVAVSAPANYVMEASSEIIGTNSFLSLQITQLIGSAVEPVNRNWSVPFESLHYTYKKYAYACTIFTLAGLFYIAFYRTCVFQHAHIRMRC